MIPSCKTCAWETENGTIDLSQTVTEMSALVGVDRASIYRHLAHKDVVLEQPIQVAATYSWELGDKDFEGNSPTREKPATSNDVENFLRERGLNPDEWDYTFRFSEWEQSSKTAGLTTLHAFRVAGKRKQVKNEQKWEQAYIDRIAAFKPVKIDSTASQESLVIVPTDFQIGKVDVDGGTFETIDSVMNSFHRIAEYAKQHKPREICIIEAGDIIENIYNVSSQLGTNDLGLPHQVALAYELMLTGIQLLAPLAPSIKYITVPSNHGTHRLGPKSPAGAVHDDWGVMLGHILKTSVKLSPGLDHVEVIMPAPFIESVAFETSGSSIGVVHGHQASSPDRIGEWWAKQTHGNMPVAPARILVAGHWHSMRVQQSGDARWVFVGPTSDRGSSWYTNKTGEKSTTGMLGFKTNNNTWSDIQIF